MTKKEFLEDMIENVFDYVHDRDFKLESNGSYVWVKLENGEKRLIFVDLRDGNIIIKFRFWEVEYQKMVEFLQKREIEDVEVKVSKCRKHAGIQYLHLKFLNTPW